MPMVEFVWWPGTTAFLSDLENIISPTIAHISSAKGCLKICYGLEEEDKSKFWMIVVWQSHAHHQAMMDSPDYALMVGRLKPYFAGELKMNHVEFVNDERPAFSAPITEISFLRSRRDSITEAKDSEADDEALRSLLNVTTSGGGIGVTWGQTQEEDALRIVVAGWGIDESYQNPSPSESFDVETIHVKFQEVFGPGAQ